MENEYSPNGVTIARALAESALRYGVAGVWVIAAFGKLVDTNDVIPAYLIADQGLRDVFGALLIGIECFIGMLLLLKRDVVPVCFASIVILAVFMIVGVNGSADQPCNCFGVLTSRASLIASHGLRNLLLGVAHLLIIALNSRLSLRGIRWRSSNPC